MILSTGIDLCDIRRIERALAKHPARFMDKYFTSGEKTYAKKQANPAATLAKRWAAKEACAKALGTGFRGGVTMRDIEVVHTPSKKPEIRLHGKAKQVFSRFTDGASCRMHLALTDEYPYALAQVMITAIHTSETTWKLSPKSRKKAMTH